MAPPFPTNFGPSPFLITSLYTGFYLTAIMVYLTPAPVVDLMISVSFGLLVVPYLSALLVVGPPSLLTTLIMVYLWVTPLL
jgi:hypothetical protein